jgi:hypothetical protein
MSKDLLQTLNTKGLTEFGSVIDEAIIYAALGIEIPDVGTRDQFRAIELIVLSAIDYCRKALLDEGKYLEATSGGYRILLPSENSAQVRKYMTAADRKLKRGLKLSKNTPKMDTKTPDNTDVRIQMKLDQVEESKRMAGVMS